MIRISFSTFFLEKYFQFYRILIQIAIRRRGALGEAEWRWEDLFGRVVLHNCSVIAERRRWNWNNNNIIIQSTTLIADIFALLKIHLIPVCKIPKVPLSLHSIKSRCLIIILLIRAITIFQLYRFRSFAYLREVPPPPRSPPRPPLFARTACAPLCN